MKLHKIKIDGKVYTAAFNLNSLEKLAEMAGPFEDGRPLDANDLMQLWTTQQGIIRCALVLIREGERMEGRECDLDEDYIRAHMSPAEHMWLQRKVAAIMVDGMRMETLADDEEEVDEVLEELKKKLTTEE